MNKKIYFSQQLPTATYNYSTATLRSKMSTKCTMNLRGQQLTTTNNNCTESGFHFLEDHGTDEVVETIITTGFALFVKRRLGIGLTVNLRLKTNTEIVDEGKLLIGGRGTWFECVKESFGTCGRLAKMLEMSKFGALRRIMFVITGMRDHERLGGRGVSDDSVGVADVFLTLDELVVAVKRTGHSLDGSVKSDFCHCDYFFDRPSLVDTWGVSMIAHIWSMLGW